LFEVCCCWDCPELLLVDPAVGLELAAGVVAGVELPFDGLACAFDEAAGFQPRVGDGLSEANGAVVAGADSVASGVAIGAESVESVVGAAAGASILAVSAEGAALLGLSAR